MTKFLYTNSQPGTFEYPAYAIVVSSGAILDGALSTPQVTTPPDAYWSIYTGALAETGVTRTQGNSTATGGGSSASALGSDPADSASVIAAAALARVNQQAQNTTGRASALVRARVSDIAAPMTETWANTSAWAGPGTTGSGRVFASTGGLTIAAPTSPRWILRTTIRSTGSPGKFVYVGCGSSTAAANLVGIGQTSAGSSPAIATYVGSGLAAGSVVAPRAFANLTAADYPVTIAKDETHVSLTVQSPASGQTVYGVRVPISAFPGGAINTIYVSCSGASAAVESVGPMLVYPELAVPPAAVASVGGVQLYGASNPVTMLRADPSTGIGHALTMPGDVDSRVPMPLVLFMHQASTGTAMSPYTESRMASVLSALLGGGYALLSSDNGPATTGGGTQDKYANQAGLDDYAAAVLWARQHFHTGPLFLLGASQGGLTALQMLQRRDVGGIAAAALVSPASNMIVAEQNADFQAPLRAAYGATSTSDFATKVAGYNPAAEPSSKFRTCPLRMYVGSLDPTAPPAQHVTPLVSKLTGVTPDLTVIGQPVGHLDTALYTQLAAEVVPFFNTYRG